MKTVKVQPNQNVFDLAVQHYGTLDGVEEILRLNPQIENDPAALLSLGIDTLQENAFRLDVAVHPGTSLNIDEKSKTIDGKTVKKINNPITTYETWQDLSPKSKKQ